MKKSLFQKIVCLCLSVTLLLGVFAMSVSAASVLKPGGTAATLEEMESVVGTTSYADYISNYPQNTTDLATITLLNSTAEGNYEVVDDDFLLSIGGESEIVKFKAESGWENSIYLPSIGSTTWRFTIPEGSAGRYCIRIVYYNCQTAESSISTIERKLYIDDKIPFSEASNLSLTKYWNFKNCEVVTTDTSEPDSYDVDYNNNHEDGYVKTVTSVINGKKTVTTYTLSEDINGNSMLPDTQQFSQWNTYYCQDSTGYHQGYFGFYLLNGTHTITLEAEREPMIIKSIELIPENATATTIPSYEEVKQSYTENGYTAPTDGKMTVIQAEFPDYVSDSSVYATNDNTSAATFPVASNSQKYNVIGENSYSTVGQWAAYNFQVTKDGLYKFAMRYKQDALQGMYICRTVKLSGGHYGETPTVPFMEAYDIQYNYDKAWQSKYISDGNGTEFEFYFEAGKEYTIYLECSLGTLRDPLNEVERSLEKINDCYLRILQLTGNEPDEYRDYDFLGIMPDVLISLLEEAKTLDNVQKEFEELCGTGAHLATLHTIAILLDKMGSNDGYDIAANMGTLKSYLGTLGTWINDSKRSSMMVDSISVCPSNTEAKSLPRANANFFQSIFFEISSFFHSFFTKYDQMGMTVKPSADAKKIDVWLATGRDQSQIWRTMIDAKDGFTDTTGVAVTLKLVTGGTLLPSILSGKGPDVYIGLGAADVINYAIRDAVVGISGNDKRLEANNPGANEIFSSNYYTYRNNDGTYVISETEDTSKEASFVSRSYEETIGGNYVKAAMDTVTLLDVTYGIPQTMSFSMMFYRMDVLANLGQEVPDSWSQLLALLPVLQTNNMSIGLSYGNAIEFMLYQMGGNMWQYTDSTKYSSEYAGAKIALDTDIAKESFKYVCRLYSDYSFPVTYDAANRFRTGEMPIIIGDYATIYNQLVVYATEIAGLWEFSSLPGSQRKDGSFNYDSIAGIGATVMLHGCRDVLSAWQFMQWQTSAAVQANYGNKMVALIGPSAKYEAANVNAINNLSWTASEKEAILDQMEHLSSIVNYPGSYIISRYTKFAFLAAVNDGAEPVDALMGYIDAINAEIKRKREEFNLKTLGAGEEAPQLSDSAD